MQRPCCRCVRLGLQDSCVDYVRKIRQKGLKRGPYRKDRAIMASYDASFRLHGGVDTSGSVVCAPVVSCDTANVTVEPLVFRVVGKELSSFSNDGDASSDDNNSASFSLSTPEDSPVIPFAQSFGVDLTAGEGVEISMRHNGNLDSTCDDFCGFFTDDFWKIQCVTVVNTEEFASDFGLWQL